MSSPQSQSQHDSLLRVLERTKVEMRKSPISSAMKKALLEALENKNEIKVKATQGR